MSSKPDEPVPPFPPAVRRYEVGIAAVFLSSVLGSVATPFVLMRIAPAFPKVWALPGIPLVCVTSTFGAIWFARRRTARVRRAVQAASGRACVVCLYDLSGLGDTGSCPECGRRFDAGTDRRAWERARML